MSRKYIINHLTKDKMFALFSYLNAPVKRDFRVRHLDLTDLANKDVSYEILADESFTRYRIYIEEEHIFISRGEFLQISLKLDKFKLVLELDDLDYLSGSLYFQKGNELEDDYSSILIWETNLDDDLDLAAVVDLRVLAKYFEIGYDSVEYI